MRFTAHPATWLNAERWRDGEGSSADSAPVFDAAAFAALWNGRAAPLVARIGAKTFARLFAEAEFSEGPPAMFHVKLSVQRDRILSECGPQIEEIYGNDVRVVWKG